MHFIFSPIGSEAMFIPCWASPWSFTGEGTKSPSLPMGTSERQWSGLACGLWNWAAGKTSIP